MRIVFSSQFRDSSGYGSAARSYLKAIDKVIEGYDYDFNILSIEVESISTISKDEEELIRKYELTGTQIDNIVDQEYILIWHQPTGMLMFGDQALKHDKKWISFKKLLDNSNKNINMSVWESNKIPELWHSLHKKYNTSATIVPCEWNRLAFKDNGVKSYVLPHVIEDVDMKSTPIKGFPDLKDKFVCFSMSQWNNRKGFDILIKSFYIEFFNNPDAYLIIKTYINAMNLKKGDMAKQRTLISNQITQIKNSIRKDRKTSQAKILVICDILPYDNISWLYEQSDLFILTTRGEGFGLTISEAIMHEKPVIVPDFGGHVDYLDPQNSFVFSGNFMPYLGSPEHDYDMLYYEPNILEVCEKLRQCYNIWSKDPKILKDIGLKSKQYIEKSSYDFESIGHSFMSIVLGEINLDKTIKSKIISSNSTQQKLNLLKNLHEGEDCYILTCGPSLKKYNPEFLKEKLKGKKVFAIKQAYDYVPEIIDYHFFNVNNFEVYNYINNRPIVFATSAENELACCHSIWTNRQEYDIFTFIPNDKDFNQALCNSLDFDRYLFDNTLLRPWGPGMMTEVVIYAAVHMGFKNVYTIGWDLEKPGSIKSNHFYENKNLIRPADPMKQEEIALNIETTRHLYKWLKKKRINLFVANDNSYVHKSVPRRILK